MGHASENCWKALTVVIQEIQEPMDPRCSDKLSTTHGIPREQEGNTTKHMPIGQGWQYLNRTAGSMTVKTNPRIVPIPNRLVLGGTTMFNRCFGPCFCHIQDHPKLFGKIVWPLQTVICWILTVPIYSPPLPTGPSMRSSTIISRWCLQIFQERARTNIPSFVQPIILGGLQTHPPISSQVRLLF